MLHRVLLVVTFACAAATVPAPVADGARIVLGGTIRSEALPLMTEHNYLGLGKEAMETSTWLIDRSAPVTIDPTGLALEDAAGARRPVSDSMMITLRRLTQWYALAAPKERPITHAQLEAGALSPASVARIQAVFDNVVGRGVWADRKWMTPETGGEAALDGELRLVESHDPRWAVVEALARGANDPMAIATLYETRRADVAPLDTHALLRLGLERFKLGSPGSAEEVRRAVALVIENSALTYAHDPAEQFALIAGHDWKGRYVGRWHTHPPHDGGTVWLGGEVPSFEDMQNAVDAGQYLTLSFQPDGFDLYDAGGLADAGRVELALLKVTRYRSTAWKSHFQALRQNLTAPR